ncbi:MAG: GNAT family N-acetyltransferase [Chloroflexi bacterium]|nr:GNAT family N-acetyltransferase [Chloroflexota bacterium]
MTRRIKLRDKDPSDAFDDYSWETDPELAELDAAPVMNISYSQYLMDYTWDLRTPRTTSRQFAVDTLDGKHIGNCSYYNLDRSRGEVELGIMIGDRNYWSKGYGVDVIEALLEHVFQQMKVNRVHLKTLDWNARAQKCFQKCGFKQCGQISRDGFNFMLMEVFRKDWESNTG